MCSPSPYDQTQAITRIVRDHQIDTNILIPMIQQQGSSSLQFSGLKMMRVVLQVMVKEGCEVGAVEPHLKAVFSQITSSYNKVGEQVISILRMVFAGAPKYSVLLIHPAAIATITNEIKKYFSARTMGESPKSSVLGGDSSLKGLLKIGDAMLSTSMSWELEQAAFKSLLEMLTYLYQKDGISTDFAVKLIMVMKGYFETGRVGLQ